LLPLKVAPLYIVPVNERYFLYPRSRKGLGVPCSKSACSYNQNMLFLNLLLSAFSNRLKQFLAGITINQPILIPSVGLLAVAYCFFSIRPASNAARPASIASFIARAIFTGSFAPETAVFNNTPSAPSSIA